MSQPIIFYDIPGRAADDRAWSPNTWKTRLSLNYKQLPYRTVWVEYPDIERVCREIGAPPTAFPSGRPPSYTLPAIYDPNTHRAISDSINIARYLDETYPSTPVLVPRGTDAAQDAFQDAFTALAVDDLYPFMIPRCHAQLNSVSLGFYRRKRELDFGRMDHMSPPGPTRKRQWKGIKEAFRTIASWAPVGGRRPCYFVGDRFSYAEITLGAFLIWMKRVLGAHSPEWADVVSWDGGRWAQVAAAFVELEVVDEGMDYRKRPAMPVGPHVTHAHL